MPICVDLCSFAAARVQHVAFTFVSFLFFMVHNASGGDFAVLNPTVFSHYIERFNSMEDENITNFVSNTNSWNWLQKEIPFFIAGRVEHAAGDVDRAGERVAGVRQIERAVCERRRRTRQQRGRSSINGGPLAPRSKLSGRLRPLLAA